MPAAKILAWERDGRSPVFARSNWEIPQLDFAEYVRQSRWQTEALVRNRASATLKALEKKNKRIMSVRSVSPYMYNCVGMIFSSRRAWIEIDHLHDILCKDGYAKISKENLDVGDVVVHTRVKPEHVGLVTYVPRLESDDKRIRVLSKWGADGEIEHFIDVVPEGFGKPSEYWSEKSSYGIA